MSVEAITWALKQSIPSSSTKFVLVVVANCADGRSFTAYPSIAYLTEATGQDRKTVIANLKRLCELGYLQDTGNRVGRTKQVVVYQLAEPAHNSPENGTVPPSANSPETGTVNEPETVPKTGSFTPETVPFFPGNSTVFPSKQSQKRDTEPSGNRQVNKNQNQERGARAARLPPEWTLPDDWRVFAKTQNPRWSDSDIDRIAATFADHWHAAAGASARKVDWFATWRNWIRREAQFGKRPAVRAPAPDNFAERDYGIGGKL